MKKFIILILIFLFLRLFLLFYYTFFLFDQILNYLNWIDNNKKKNYYDLTLGLDFLFQKYFGFFIINLKWKKKFIFSQFGNNQ
jgi:hypothetical protein